MHRGDFTTEFLNAAADKRTKAKRPSSAPLRRRGNQRHENAGETLLRKKNAARFGKNSSRSAATGIDATITVDQSGDYFAPAVDLKQHRNGTCYGTANMSYSQPQNICRGQYCHMFAAEEMSQINEKRNFPSTLYIGYRAVALGKVEEKFDDDTPLTKLFAKRMTELGMTIHDSPDEVAILTDVVDERLRRILAKVSGCSKLSARSEAQKANRRQNCSHY